MTKYITPASEEAARAVSDVTFGKKYKADSQGWFIDDQGVERSCYWCEKGGMVDYVEKTISPEDEVTITTTYGELARIYFAMGRVNCVEGSDSMWRQACDLLDADKTVYNSYEDVICDEVGILIDYSSVRDSWLNALFQTEVNFEIKEKEDQIKALQQEIDELKSKT